MKHDDALILNVHTEGDGAFKHLQGEKAKHGMITDLAGLEAGTKKGFPSVAIAIKLDDGGYVVAETTLKMFLVAAKALEARYGTI